MGRVGAALLKGPFFLQLEETMENVLDSMQQG